MHGIIYMPLEIETSISTMARFRVEFHIDRKF